MERTDGSLFLLAGHAVFLRIEKFGEARVLLEESKILVIARMVAILCSQLNGDLEIGHGGIGLAGEAIKGSQSVMNMVRFGRRFAGFQEALARVVPAADVHHADSALIMLFGGPGILFRGRFHALLGDLEVHASTIGELFAGASQNFFEFLLGFGKFLLMKEGQGLIVDFELGLDARVYQFDSTALGGGRWR